jgi:hypothetical protein
VSTFSNTSRSTAEMVADGSVSRPTYLDVGGQFAAAGAIPVERSRPCGASEAPPVAAAVDKQAAAERLWSADRTGRLLH